MAIYLILISAFFAALQNFVMRRSVDTTGSTDTYVPMQLFVSMVIATILNPVQPQSLVSSLPTIGVGLAMGAFLGIMMFSLGQAMKYGPASLTVGILNSSSVLPAVLMAAAFGTALGHPYHWWNGLGSAIVVAGILWSAKSNESHANKARWSVYTLFSVIAFVLFSAMTQWRVLLERIGGGHLLLPFQLDPANSAWFMPAIFLSAALFQFVVLAIRGGGKITRQTLKFGLFGGIANGCSMYFMVWATQVANGWQNALLFPLFSIAIIQICNLWGKVIYKEQIQWLPSTICIAGLVIGAVQWSLIGG